MTMLKNLLVAGEDIVVEDEAEEQIDPRWNELKKY